MSGRKILFLLIWVPLCFASCHKPAGNIQVDFSFSVDGRALVQDTFGYMNEAGNRYEVSEAQYFVSNIILTRNDGTQIMLMSDRDAHYVDADIIGTLSWLPTDEIPAGKYQALTFTFGLAPELNQNYFYPDAPENAMSWPANLGGGYHYMKINGWWIDADGVRRPFNLHTGIGQLRNEQGEITGFVDNSFTVTLPLNDLVITDNQTSKLQIEMDINRWFTNPYLFDFNIFGGSIMQNQEAQEMLKANGTDVFRVR